MDQGTAVVVGQIVLGVTSIIVALIGAWVSITKSDDRAALTAERTKNARLRKRVESLGGEPDED